MHKFLFTAMAAFILTAPFAQEHQPGKKPNLVVKVNLSKIQYPLEKIFLSYYNSSTKVRYTDSIDLLQQP
ncbi:MAG: hypothetical protein GXC73_17175, partial [Chitinophagaceae bacterium]|nr:hypothetical protein [Chitinophagaceae bacterium]